MKVSLLSSAKRRLALAYALLAGAVAALPLACSTSDKILAWEETPDAESSLVRDSGLPPYVPGCGNGIRDEGEECDDNNLTSGDGCSSTCTIDPMPPKVCPGIPIPLTGADPSKRTGSVTGVTTDRTRSLDSPNCGGGNGKDIVYSITSIMQGLARVRLEASYDALLYVRTACADALTEVTCKSVPFGGGKTDVAFPMSANQTVYLVVDGVGGTAGSYKLDVEVGTTLCGDGIAQYPEQCDDGNATNGDGCSVACQLEAPSAAPGKCPGASYTLVGTPGTATKVSFAGDITALANTMGSFGCGGGSGPDQAYAITPTISGAITAELHASYPASLLHVRGECFSSGTELDCRKGPLASVPIRTTFPVEANKTYFIFADTDTYASDMDPGTGVYTLDVTLTSSTCGNGVLELPEECDDGDMTDGDGCTATCTLEPLPAGIDDCPGAPITFTDKPDGTKTFRTTGSNVTLTPSVKSCAGGSDRKDAVYTFQPPMNGWLTAKARGSYNIALDLRSNCAPESGSSTGTSICGNAKNGDDDETLSGAVAAGNTYYLVVDTGPFSTNREGVYTLDISIKPSVCGNGVIEGGEACDDGNLATGDGCDGSCSIEPTPTLGVSCTSPEPIALVEGAPGEYSASVKGGTWNRTAGGTFGSSCGGTSGKEAYYTVTPPIDGILVADVDATYNIVPGVRLSCPHSGTTFLTCSNRSLGPGGEHLAFAVSAGTTYWIILDSPSTSTNGAYSMHLSLKGPSCGDGVLNGSEQCDDGNLLPGDGCSATCTLEPVSGVDTCPGHAVMLAGTGTTTREGQLTVSTASLTSNYSATCGGSDRDGVVAVTSDIGGTMVAQLTSAWPAVFYARSTCTDSSAQLGCSKADPTKPSDTLRELTLTVQPNVPVYLFVDGLAGASGPANLSLTVTP
jgi:cysteine-rich repeat protein